MVDLRFLLWNKHEKELAKYVQSKFGITPEDIQLYKLAFIHSSAKAIQEPNAKKFFGKQQANERLEFLGDSILGAIVSKWLYDKFPQAQEGKLSKLKSVIISRATLNQIAVDFQIQKFLVEKRKLNSFEHIPLKEQNIFGNALEAVVGAIFLDKGFKKTEKAVRLVLDKSIDFSKLAHNKITYKSSLNEFLQNAKLTFSYEVDKIEGTQNNPLYHINLIVEDNYISSGVGKSKKAAEQEAAKKALLFYNVIKPEQLG